MSLFQQRSEEALDVFHLSAHGCDVVFSQYDAGDHEGPRQNARPCRNLIVRGQVRVRLQNQETTYHSDEWFEVPGGISHHIDFLDDCDIIEFWFSAA